MNFVLFHCSFFCYLYLRTNFIPKTTNLNDGFMIRNQFWPPRRAHREVCLHLTVSIEYRIGCNQMNVFFTF